MPTRSPWPSPSARPGSCPGRSAGPPTRSWTSRARRCRSTPGTRGRGRARCRARHRRRTGRCPRARGACEMKAVLHEFASAVRSGMSPIAPRRVVVVVGERLAVDDDASPCTGPPSCGVSPARSSARELTVLKVEPGRELAERRQVEPAGAGPVGRGQDLAGARPESPRGRSPDATPASSGSASICRSRSRLSWRGWPGGRLGAEELAPDALVVDRVDLEARASRAACRRTAPAGRRSRRCRRPGSRRGSPRSSRRSPRRPGRGAVRRTPGSGASGRVTSDDAGPVDPLDGRGPARGDLLLAVDDRLHERLRHRRPRPAWRSPSGRCRPAWRAPGPRRRPATPRRSACRCRPGTTCRSVTSASPRAPTMSPRSGVSEVSVEDLARLEAGLDQLGRPGRLPLVVALGQRRA